LPKKGPDDGTEKTKLLLLYTGGTMGMKPNKEGALVPVPGKYDMSSRKEPLTMKGLAGHLIWTVTSSHHLNPVLKAENRS